MESEVFYRERLPKYVFDGSWYTRRGVRIAQFVYRLAATSLFLGTLILIFFEHFLEHGSGPFMSGFIIFLIWLGCALILHSSEIKDRSQLDGNVPTIITSDRISIPPRKIRRMTGAPNYIPHEEIDHIKVVRGKGHQYIGKKSGVYWENSPIDLIIVTITGKRFKLGIKPPSTVKEIVDVLASDWGIHIVDSGSGMGSGRRYEKDEILWELPYEEIMMKNLFEWQV